MKGFYHTNVRVVAGLAVGIFFLACPVRAMVINVTYDSSVTNFGTLTQVQTAFGTVAQTFQNLYTNAITINITVYSANAGPFGDIGLGESETEVTGNFNSFKYPQLTNALRRARTTAADSNSVTSLPASDPTGGTTNMWWMPRAEAKALGVLLSANDPNPDGAVGFATNVTFTFDPNNRSVSGAYDFIGIAEHELTEAMGRTTFRLSSTNFVPYDLFRFTNNGARSLNLDGVNVYFSANNGTTVLKYFNPNNGGDIQDWQSSSPPDSFDALVPDSAELILSYADLISMDILGFKLNFKAPRATGTHLGNGNFQINFTNMPGMGFVVQVSTNLSSTNNWTDLGAPTEGPEGQYQFIDAQTAGSVRFYRIKLP